MRKTTLATTPTLLLLGQVGQMPFSNYVIQPDETGVWCHCEKLPTASGGSYYRCIVPQWNSSSLAFGLWNELFYNVNAILRLILSGATNGS